MEANEGAGLGYQPQQSPPDTVHVVAPPLAIQPLMTSLEFVQGHTQVPSEISPQFPNTDTFVSPATATLSEQDAAQQALEGRLRAQAILQKFQQVQQAMLLVPRVNESSEQPSSIYVNQRRQAAIRERRRRQEALHKNFDYLASKLAQQQDAAHHDDALAAAQAQEAAAQARYQQVLEDRKQKLQQIQQKQVQTQAGIGTHQRKRAQAVVQQQQQQQPSQAAVYLSGLPTDGSVSWHMLRDVFGAYGHAAGNDGNPVAVQKVHLYRDKRTGELKGDGLVVFGVPRDSELGQTLIETVCGQVSVEMPGF